MDLEAIAGVTDPSIDEDAVGAEVTGWVEGRDVDSIAQGLREPWKITSLGAADWAIRRLAECQARAQEYRDEIALWQDAARRIESAGEWFEDRLKEWAVEQRSPQRKTFPLAHGTVSTRQSQPKIEVVDEPAAILWAKVAAPGAVKVTEAFRVSEVKGAADIVECVVAFAATNKSTGEMERIEVEPAPVDPERIAALVDKMGDGYVVEPIMALRVVDTNGKMVPGLAVRLGSVTASVTPLA